MTAEVLISHVVGKGKQCRVTFINDSNRYIKIKKSTPIGHLEEMNIMEENDSQDHTVLRVQNSDSNMSNPPLQTQLPELPAHLTDLYQRFIKHLNNEEHVKLQRVLIDYEDVFGRHDLDLGCLTDVKQAINTRDSAPVNAANSIGIPRFRTAAIRQAVKSQGLLSSAHHCGLFGFATRHNHIQHIGPS